MTMPKISKRFITIWAPAIAGLIVILTLSFIELYYSLKVSDGIGFNSKKANAPAGKKIFYKLGCVRCHNIRALNIKGGHVGPDLSGAYSDAKKVYKENVNGFLKNPVGTMYFVLLLNHLSKEDRKIITAELKKAQNIQDKMKNKKIKDNKRG
ncbi:MAG: c-type cytochrome [Deltaproteobacteria bacterium]|nr:c-type cytochrome [Deltaproteobacteria bacterium]